MPDRNPDQCLDIFVIDDNEDHQTLITHAIKRSFQDSPATIRVRTFDRPAVALAELQGYDTPRVILIDYQLGTSTGIEWLGDFVNANAGPVIMMTSSGDERIAAQAFRIGASDYFNKSSIIQDPMPLRDSIRSALRKTMLEQTNRDLSVQLRNLNDDLNEKNQRLQQLTDSAHRFVEDVAHEFRTPLTVIREFTSIILDGLGGDVSDKQKQYLTHILNSSSELASLVDDFLNSSRLRCGNIRVNRASHCMPEVFAGVQSALENRACAKNIALRFEVDENLPKVFVDLDKARRTLQNLIINAIKYSDAGSTVTISVNQDDESCVQIRVQDEGPGVDPKQKGRLLSRFERGTCADTGSESGFGLGLNIVCDLVRINFGKLSLKSELGEGSVFGFTLPVDQSHHIVSNLLRTSGMNPDSRVCLLEVTREGQANPSHDIRSVIRPLDLVLRHPISNAVLLVAVTDNFEQFRERLFLADRQMRQHKQGEHDADLCFSLIEEMSVTEALQHGLKTFNSVVTNQKEKNYA